ncbi:hypothetical protein G4B88_009487 [Cannabis sativa]|uniref:Uncharacterized protein n=2 Tax=Cannabis sativa TaxID=3483 RepID=A0A7J6EUU8_CANSA|nr:hypothetical protein G4B88_009487 [Cannabis sativa]
MDIIYLQSINRGTLFAMSRTPDEDLESKYYRHLKNGAYKVKASNSTYRCPFCLERRKTYYKPRELRLHAYDVSRSSHRRDYKEKAKHLALEEYIRRYHEDRVEPSPKLDSCSSKLEYRRHDRFESSRKLEYRTQDQTEPRSKLECQTLDLSEPSSKVKFPTLDGANPSGKLECPPYYPSKLNPKLEWRKHEHEELLVWPPMGILANIQTELKNGKRVGESGSKLRDQLIGKGFSPVKVIPLWNFLGHSGFAIVEFNNQWTGFQNAIAFEKSFEADNCGKMAFRLEKNRGDRMFGWVARADDFNSSTIIGIHLRKNGDLKSVSEKEAEEKRKDSRLFDKLAETLETQASSLEEWKTKYEKASVKYKRMEEKKEKMIEDFNEKLRIMQQENHEYLKGVLSRHKSVSQNLKSQMDELLSREKQLQQREFNDDSERMKIEEEKKMVEKATMEQNKAEKNMLDLAKEQKKEKEELRKKIIELEKQLDSEQALVLTIERMRGALEVMKHMGGDEDMEVEKNMKEIQEQLKEKEEEYEALEDLSQALIVKERRSNDELQQARKEMISGLKDSSHRALIGVKRLGELDSKPFLPAAERIFSVSGEEAEIKALELCSLWETHLKDPSWHPFKVMDKGGKTEEIIDEEDENLNNLKNECGDEAYGAVIKALKELNEYNPSGRYIIQELWNFKEERKAPLKEGVDFILRNWRQNKRKKN